MAALGALPTVALETAPLIRGLPDCRQRTRFEPKRAGCCGGIEASLLPPSGFVADAVHLAMVSAAQRDGELIADLAPERPALGEAQVVGVQGWRPQIRQGCLGDIPDVIAVTNPARLRELPARSCR